MQCLVKINLTLVQRSIKNSKRTRTETTCLKKNCIKACFRRLVFLLHRPTSFLLFTSHILIFTERSAGNPNSRNSHFHLHVTNWIWYIHRLDSFAGCWYSVLLWILVFCYCALYWASNGRIGPCVGSAICLNCWFCYFIWCIFCLSSSRLLKLFSFNGGGYNVTRTRTWVFENKTSHYLQQGLSVDIIEAKGNIPEGLRYPSWNLWLGKDPIKKHIKILFEEACSRLLKKQRLRKDDINFVLASRRFN